MLKIWVFILFIGSNIYCFSQNNLIDRNNDPILILGSFLPSFSTLLPKQIVGFKYQNNIWFQIPIQIDECAVHDIVRPYGSLAGTHTGSGYLPPEPSESNPKIVFYCDSTTYIGKDPNPNFDVDDELVFMAKDAGQFFNGNSYPTGINASNCKQIKITDPITNLSNYIYLFENQSILSQSAGINYINYSSNLASTSGFPANDNGTNLENTNITTSKYSWHFSSEWVSDELKIKIGNNTDILDRHKSFFANGNQGCLRHEGLFSSGENAFVTVKTGPIRVIRSYMGAQSGPLTQRTHLFYEGRQDILTTVRVHAIPSIYDVFDYEPAALAMIYKNNFNQTGVQINGIQDQIIEGLPYWEQISGVPGSISILNRITTNLTSSDANLVGYYDDNSTNPASNCSGTNGAWGSSGLGIVFNAAVCTDCYYDATLLRNINVQKTIYVESSSISTQKTITYSNKLDIPLQIIVSECSSTNISSKNKTTDITQINLYPNPTTGIIKIKSLLETQNYDIILYDIFGKEKKRFYDTNEFDISAIKQGIYFIAIKQNNLTSYHKITKY